MIGKAIELSYTEVRNRISPGIWSSFWKVKAKVRFLSCVKVSLLPVSIGGGPSAVAEKFLHEGFISGNDASVKKQSKEIDQLVEIHTLCVGKGDNGLKKYRIKCRGELLAKDIFCSKEPVITP